MFPNWKSWLTVPRLDCSYKRRDLCWSPALFLGIWSFGTHHTGRTHVASPKWEPWEWGLWQAFLGRSVAYVWLHFHLWGRSVLCGPSQEGQSIRKPTYGLLQMPPVSFYSLWYCPVSFQCRSLSCDYNYTLTHESSPNVRVILWTLQNRITAYLGLNSFFVSFKRRKWQFSNAVCPITEGPDDLPWTEPRPAFPPYNYVLLLFSLCNCKKMGPDFHIVLPGNEHPPTHWIPGIHATF